MVKTCLNRVCQIFNYVLGITGVIVLGVAVIVHMISRDDGDVEELLPALVLSYCVGILVLILSILGIYGSRKEKKCCLILYSIGALLMAITLFLIGGIGAPSDEELAKELAEMFDGKKPLDEADQSTQSLVEAMQVKWDCCGLDVGYQDWGEQIPTSCRCLIYDNTSKCIEVHHGSAHLTVSVYSQPCLPFFMDFMNTFVKVFLGLCFGFGLLMILGAVLVSALLCQMRRRMTSAPVSYSVQSTGPEHRGLFSTA